jgi:hypothetical protein
LAAGGYKQPQQLIVLAYLLSLGAEFDLLVNLDGFNEAALPLAENAPARVSPFFPRKWLVRIDPLSDLALFGDVAAGVSLRASRIRYAAIFSSPLLVHSFTMNLVWEAIDHFHQGRLADTEAAIARRQATAHSFAASGPRVDFSDEEAVIRAMVDVWAAASLGMKALADANGIRYFHFLQPNQYLPGSKPLSAAEVRLAYDVSHLYKRPVELVYPRLISAGGGLRDRGVRYRDLTAIFANNPSTLYVDACCHLNKEGSELIASEIAATILSAGSGP